MKRVFYIGCIILFFSCNVSVEEKNDKGPVSGFDSTLNKVDDKLEEWGDSAKEKFKDIKTDVKDRFAKDSPGRGDK